MSDRFAAQSRSSLRFYAAMTRHKETQSLENFDLSSYVRQALLGHA
ncbi:MAG: hypothetical protein V7L13_30555 [Nostoc sp.]